MARGRRHRARDHARAAGRVPPPPRLPRGDRHRGVGPHARRSAARWSRCSTPAAVLGGLYVARDGLCKAINTCDVLLRQAESRGAEINDLTEVTGFDIRDGRMRGVETSNGHDRGHHRDRLRRHLEQEPAGASPGVPMPLQPMQHLMAYTVPLPELAGHTTEVEHPIMRHQDRSMYFKQRGDSYGIGAYRHEPLTIEPREFARERRRPHDGPAAVHRGATSPTPAMRPTRCCRRFAASSSPTASTATSRSRPTATRCSASPRACAASGSPRASGSPMRAARRRRSSTC